MRRTLGWILFLVGGVACLVGMFGLMGALSLPVNVGIAELETDSEMIDWLVVWLIVWSIGLFLLAKKKPADETPGQH